jgi:hypothetical protein
VLTSQESSGKSTHEFAPVASTLSPSTAEHSAAIADYKIIRRNGAVVSFEPSKISIAMTKAFLAVNGGQGAASARVRELVEQLTQMVVAALVRRQPAGGTFHIEDVQDQVELSLMRSGEHDVARAYVLYRAKRQEERAQQQASKGADAPHAELHIGARDIVLAGTHQRQLDLILHVFDVEGAAGRLAAHQRCHDHLRELLDQLAHARRCRALPAVDGEEGLGHRDRDLRRLETDHCAIAADDLVIGDRRRVLGGRRRKRGCDRREFVGRLA